MITKISLHNWKSFQEASLFIDPITVLIGLNASGKSNVIDALRFLQRSTSMPLTTAITGWESQTQEIRGGIEWVCLKGEDSFRLEVLLKSPFGAELKYELEVVVVENGSTKKAYVKEEKLFKIFKRARIKDEQYRQIFWTDPCDDRSEYLTARMKNRRGAPFQLHRQNSVLAHTASMQLGSEIRDVTDFLRGVLQKIYILDPVPIHMRDYCRLGDMLLPDGSNVAGVIAGLAPAEKDKVEKALTKYVGNLPDNPFEKIYVELVGKFQQDAMLYGTEHLPNQSGIEVDARSMSDGTLRTIAILTAIFTRPKESLLVIEEVDNGLHPSKAGFLLNLLLELGQQQGVDILITTHNPALMDSLEKDLLPFISLTYRDEKTGYSTIKLLEDVAILPKLMGFGSLGKIVTEDLIEKPELALV